MEMREKCHFKVIHRAGTSTVQGLPFTFLPPYLGPESHSIWPHAETAMATCRNSIKGISVGLDKGLLLRNQINGPICNCHQLPVAYFPRNLRYAKFLPSLLGKAKLILKFSSFEF